MTNIAAIAPGLQPGCYGLSENSSPGKQMEAVSDNEDLRRKQEVVGRADPLISESTSGDCDSIASSFSCKRPPLNMFGTAWLPSWQAYSKIG